MNRGAFALIFNSDDQLLLVRSLTSHPDTDHWSLPGGLVEQGETDEEGAIRETAEEVGLAVELGEVLSTVESSDDNFVAVTFKATHLSGEIILQAHEIEKAEWFTFDEAKTLNLGFNIRELIDDLSSL
ncbi:MAG: NUDIX domain-containing protein [Candidatus Microsaccharimonas sp.]